MFLLPVFLFNAAGGEVIKNAARIAFLSSRRAIVQVVVVIIAAERAFLFAPSLVVA